MSARRRRGTIEADTGGHASITAAIDEARNKGTSVKDIISVRRWRRTISMAAAAALIIAVAPTAAHAATQAQQAPAASILEVEPNDSPTAAQNLGLGNTVTGIANARWDTDYYIIDNPVAQPLELDLRFNNAAAPTVRYSAYITDANLRDRGGVSPSATQGDGAAGRQLPVTVPQGRWYVYVSEASNATTVSGVKYSLTVRPALVAPVPTVTAPQGQFVGKSLTVKPGTWTAGTALSYRWLANGALISGATGAQLAMTPAMVGKVITARVTGSKSGFTAQVRTSARTNGFQVFKGTLKTATPKISGTRKVGKILTAKPGAWTAGTKFTYQWYKGGKAITGATARTLKLTKGMKGQQIRVKVSGVKPGYNKSFKISDFTARIG